MRKYYKFFQLRFQMGLQYRLASLTALITQFLWGLMECIAYRALQETNAAAFPMEFSALVSYVWLRQAFFALFHTWVTDGDIFTMITNGGISYELCRPLSIYQMWFARTIGGRLSSAAMRFVPILALAFLLPKPYCLTVPSNVGRLLLFLLTMALGLCVTTAFCMFVYLLCFFTVSSEGVRMVMTGAVDFLSGAIIPLPFIPFPVRGILELLPFASMQNVPLRIYSGDLADNDMITAILLQLFWLATLVVLGILTCRIAERRVVLQGG